MDDLMTESQELPEEPKAEPVAANTPQQKIEKTVRRKLVDIVPLDDYDRLDVRYLWDMKGTHRLRANWWRDSRIVRSEFVHYDPESGEVRFNSRNGARREVAV